MKAARPSLERPWRLLVDGRLRAAEGERRFEARDARGRVLGRASDATSRDLREAVVAARRAAPAWAARSAHERARALLRLAEMVEGRAAEISAAIAAGTGLTPRVARREVEESADRLLAFAGWCDKFGELLGGMHAVEGPHVAISTPEPLGVIGVLAPTERPLLALISLAASALCAGNTVVALASETTPLPGALLGECVMAADLPPGVLNLLTGRRAELLAAFATQPDLDGLLAAGCSGAERRQLESGGAGNLKRVAVLARHAEAWSDARACTDPREIAACVALKTVWHARTA